MAPETQTLTAGDRTSDRTGDRLRGRRPLTSGLTALAGCAALALAAMWPGLLTGHDTIVGNTGDPSVFIWSLAWTPFALSHHLNPLLTNYLHYPSGVNLMWNTSIVFPALVLAPVTDLFGPLTAYNVLCFLGMTLSGWCAYLAVRRYTTHWLSAAAGGLLYEFSPYMASQIQGHAQLFIAVFPPLLLLFGDEILVRQRGRAWLMGVLLGVAAACQLLTGSELLAISAVMAVPALITLAIVFRTEIAARRGYALRATGFAAVAFAALGAYPVYVQFLGAQRVHGVLQGFGYVASPTSFVAPSRLELISGSATVLDSSVYIGIPLLILALAVIGWRRRRPVVVAAAVTLACAVLLSLGDHLIIRGTPTGIPLPWIIAEHLPVLENVLPTRLMVAGYLALAVILGTFLDSALAARGELRLLGLGAAAVALVPLIPSVPIGSGSYAIPAFFTDGGAGRLASSGSVLMTPYGTTGVADYAPEVWQAVSGMAFRTQLGLVFTPRGRAHLWGPEMDPLGTELHDLGDLDIPAPASLAPPVRQIYLADLREHGVSAVVVGPSPGEAQVVALITELLGRPGTATGGVVLWTGVDGGSTPQITAEPR